MQTEELGFSHDYSGNFRAAFFRRDQGPFLRAIPPYFCGGIFLFPLWVRAPGLPLLYASCP